MNTYCISAKKLKNNKALTTIHMSATLPGKKRICAQFYDNLNEFSYFKENNFINEKKNNKHVKSFVCAGQKLDYKNGSTH